MPTRFSTQYPKRETMWADEATILSAGTMAGAVTTSNQYYNMYFSVSPSSNDHGSAGWGFYCAAGTYNFTAFNIKASTCGIVEFWLDGVKVSSGNDCYNVTTLWNQTIAFTVTLTAGYHTLYWLVNGKGSGSSYLYACTKVSFKQAAD